MKSDLKKSDGIVVRWFSPRKRVVMVCLNGNWYASVNLPIRFLNIKVFFKDRILTDVTFWRINVDMCCAIGFKLNIHHINCPLPVPGLP